VVIMDYNKVLVGLYLVTIAVILVELFQVWGLAIITMLILAITIVQKMNFEKALSDVKKKRNQLIDIISERLDLFSDNVDKMRVDLSRSMISIENRITGLKDSQKAENEKNYRDLARKIIEIENRLNGLKRTLGEREPEYRE
jgi:hypothetical protein